MATAKKSSKKTEAPKEEPKETPVVPLSATMEGRVGYPPNHTDEYINSEYPWFQTSQNIPQLLKALLREVVKGRMK